jgi:hypothetical protein
VLHLTPELLEATYELLRLTPPFKGWKLPHSDDLAFRVSKGVDNCGIFACWNGRRKFPHIAISATHTKTLCQLTETMAHEMVHLQEFRLGKGKWNSNHGRVFKRLAKQVCRHHELKVESF